MTSSLQAFSLPGSMYLSILGGAVWGVPPRPTPCLLLCSNRCNAVLPDICRPRPRPLDTPKVEGRARQVGRQDS